MERLRSQIRRVPVSEHALFWFSYSEKTPSQEEIERAQEILRTIEELSQSGRPILVPLRGSVEDIKYWAHDKKTLRLIESIPTETIENPILRPDGIEEENLFAALANLLGVYPRKFPHNFDRYMYFNESAYKKEGTIGEEIYNIFPIRNIGHAYWHEVVVGTSFAGYGKFVGVTLNQDFGKLVNSPIRDMVQAAKVATLEKLENPRWPT